MTTPGRNPPSYRNAPVILVHMTVSPRDGIGPDMYWCAPYEYVADPVGSNSNIPRVVCPACLMARRL